MLEEPIVDRNRPEDLRRTIVDHDLLLELHRAGAADLAEVALDREHLVGTKRVVDRLPLGVKVRIPGGAHADGVRDVVVMLLFPIALRYGGNHGGGLDEGLAGAEHRDCALQVVKGLTIEVANVDGCLVPDEECRRGIAAQPIRPAAMQIDADELAWLDAALRGPPAPG